MATEITMPKLSDTMTEGRLISWKKGVGDRVERGDVIAEVETDKATMELEAFASGILREILIKPGETAPVGTVMAMIGEEGDLAKIIPAVPPVEPAVPPVEPTMPPVEPTMPPVEPAVPPSWQPPPAEPPHTPYEPGDVPERVLEEPELEAAPPPPPVPEPAAEKASPMVRRLAREKGIDLHQVKGSGPDGRVTAEDLEKAGSGTMKAGTREDQKIVVGGKGAVSPVGGVQPLSWMRAAIARTVSEAWRTIPHFAVTVDVDMGEAERVRQELKGSGTPVSLNDFVVKALAVAIGKFPQVNASFGSDGITIYPDINIGIAVALTDGLLVPVVRGCQGLTLKVIAASSRDLIFRAKAGRISETDITGGTFTVSNLGMYGVDEFTAVINPPQGAILAVGAVGDRPVIRGGHLAAARMMRLTLSADHRLIDGAYAAKFLRELKRVLENPVVMLV